MGLTETREGFIVQVCLNRNDDWRRRYLLGRCRCNLARLRCGPDRRNVLGGLLERDLEVVAEIGAALRAAAPAAAAEDVAEPEHAAEDVGQIAEVVEDRRIEARAATATSAAKIIILCSGTSAGYY